MNENIINNISEDLNIKQEQVEKTLKLLEEGNTIPFIARYRKEVTGNLDEEQIKKINEVYMYEVNLLKRKEDVIRLIDEKGLLTEELQKQIMAATKLVEVEDLYRPYKEKKKTKATEAIKNGLEPLAKQIMAYTTKSLEELVKPYLNENVKTKEDAITGAGYIIAEWISDNAYYRKWIRNFTYNTGNLVTKVKKNAEDENKVYEMYYDFTEKVKYARSYRIMAINRAEKEKVITVNIEIDKERVFNFLEEKLIKKEGPFNYVIKDSIKDSYKRLIEPSIEREIRSELTDEACTDAINNFGLNLESLLMQPPMKDNVVLGFDPGYVNGCKLAIIDKNGKFLDSTIIKPFLNNTSNEIINKCKEKVASLIKKYNIDIIAIGNGTASRESEKFCAEMIKEYNLNCKYVIVSEAGASIYSTEKVASDEFPDLSPNERSAISIGRRLQDPLSELVKIPPAGMGVGSYQHDVSSKDLNESLDFVVTKAVNSVGVNVNTASLSLLKYVSGMTKKTIEKLINYREEKGRINSRNEIKKAKLLSDKVYEQAIGFLRITEGENILDQTAIHPESYDITLKLLETLDMDLSKVGTDELIEKLDNININDYVNKLGTDIYTLEDVIKSLKSPGRDPRDEMPQPILKSDVLDIKDLKIGMQLQGTVRNVVPFGVFIDIGLHNDGMAHISKLTDKFIKHPMEVVNVGDIVDCYVDDILLEKNKVSLSLIKPKETK
ncbi:MAG: RNA-binding transcriptional accessory protein [Bacilli bacterium]|nr:RNA-binding transcriptional accessory protein [Bacilli bacterium]